jgi:hypothetical protein
METMDITTGRHENSWHIVEKHQKSNQSNKIIYCTILVHFVLPGIHLLYNSSTIHLLYNSSIILLLYNSSIIQSQ